MATYKLIYFNSMKRAEIIRMIFKQAGVEFEDVRISQEEEWLKLKPNWWYSPCAGSRRQTAAWTCQYSTLPSREVWSGWLK